MAYPVIGSTGMPQRPERSTLLTQVLRCVLCCKWTLKQTRTGWCRVPLSALELTIRNSPHHLFTIPRQAQGAGPSHMPRAWQMEQSSLSCLPYHYQEGAKIGLFRLHHSTHLNSHTAESSDLLSLALWEVSQEFIASAVPQRTHSRTKMSKSCDSQRVLYQISGLFWFTAKARNLRDFLTRKQKS